MNIRPAQLDDVFSMATVHVHSWQVAYAHVLPSEFLQSLSVEKRATGWEKVLLGGESQNAVAEVGGEVVGLVSFGPCRDSGARMEQGEIWAIYAAPQSWGTGVGRCLMAHAMAGLTASGFSEASLWVLTSNARAIRFYGAAGFRVVPGSQKLVHIGGTELEELRFAKQNAA